MTLTAPMPPHPTPPTGPGGDAVRLPEPAASPLLRSDVGLLAAANLLIVGVLWLRHGGVGEVQSWAGAWNAAAQLSGLYATLLGLGGLTLSARSVWLERRFGFDWLLTWHRRIGSSFTILAIVHAIASVIAYAATDRVSLAHETSLLWNSYEFMVPAFIGTALLVVVTVSSMRWARRRLAYETWYFLHLTAYLAVVLAFGHQIALGSDLVHDRLGRSYWIALHAAVLALYVWSRVGGLLVAIARQRFTVTAVVPESPDTVSVYVAGPALRNLHAAAGQFFLLRILRRGEWWQAHPYSLSSAPSQRGLRFTIKALGDSSGSVASLPVGTRVVVEGPYGTFTADRRDPNRKAVLIGAGIGIAPLRALAEVLPAQAAPVVLFRARHPDDLIHLAELEVLVNNKDGYVRTLVGNRRTLPLADPFAPDALAAAVPDIAERDAFLCGPESMIAAARRGLRRLGVPASRIHYERFWY